MKKFVLIFVFCIMLLGMASELQKKIIRSQDFDIECYVSLDKLKKFENHKMYYWFKSGDIHKSLSSSGGLVLHDSYKKYYRTNQLAEEGKFNYGLKDGIWKDWHENGNLKSEMEWFDGYRQGNYKSYDIFGNIETKGRFRNNMKSGRWIDYKTKDTLNYRKDAIIIADTTSQKNFIGRLFIKRDSIQKVQYKQERLLKRRNDSIAKVMKKRKKESEKEKMDSDEGFFKRLFGKKDKN